MGKRCVLALLRAYKWAISPLLPSSCRYTPTCSEFAAEAIELHGVMKGSLLAAWRLLRCHPFVRGGYDPVPLRESLKGLDSGPAQSSITKFFRGALLRRTAGGSRAHVS